MLKTFFEAEDGAVTVDWVVITASLVGLGLAVISLISRGTEEVSNDIDSALTSGSIIQTSFLKAVTDGMTLDATISPGSLFEDLDYATAFSFQMDVSLNAGDEGILFEAGGTGRGTILYQYEGKLYLQSGNGGSYGEASDRGEAVWDVSDGDYSIEGSLDASSGLQLYIDGELVSESSFVSNDLSGGNTGAVGAGAASISRNRGSFTQSDGHPGAGELNLYLDETVPAPET